MRRLYYWVCVLGVIAGIAAQIKAEGTLYNNFNIHYYPRTGGELVASYANYVGDYPGHSVLPANTEIELDAWRGGFLVQVLETGQKIHFEFHSKRMNMSVSEYQELLFSTTGISLEELSDVDRKGIEAGEARIGMTKEGVKTALGYPAVHRTPTLESNTWIYWRNRFLTMAIRFEDGKVVDIK